MCNVVKKKQDKHTDTQKKLPEARGPAELEIGVSGATTGESYP